MHIQEAWENYKHELGPAKAIFAISGGVDSMCLLELATSLNKDQVVIAHLDHGTREDSKMDQQLVKDTTTKHKLTYESKRLNLDGNSEEESRAARYAWLDKVKRANKADYIVTAHHADDVIETMIFNLQRGTGRSGLSSLKSTKEIIRPFIHIYKEQLIEFAKAKNLEWREDSTNLDSTFSRNKIRNEVIPLALRFDPEFKETFIGMYMKLKKLNAEIDSGLDDLIEQQDNHVSINRIMLSKLGSKIGQELLSYVLRSYSNSTYDKKRIELLYDFCVSVRPKKQFPMSKSIEIYTLKDVVIFHPLDQ